MPKDQDIPKLLVKIAMDKFRMLAREEATLVLTGSIKRGERWTTSYNQFVSEPCADA